MRRGFTLVEILIVVLLLGIIAMIVVPRIVVASDEARESTLATNLVALRNAVNLYRIDHRGRLPHLDADGNEHLAGFIARLTQRTTADGALDENGSCGPYLLEWPANPFVPAGLATQLKFGVAAAPPRDDSSGWYYSTTTGTVHANSSRGAMDIDPTE